MLSSDSSLQPSISFSQIVLVLALPDEFYSSAHYDLITPTGAWVWKESFQFPPWTPLPPQWLSQGSGTNPYSPTGQCGGEGVLHYGQVGMEVQISHGVPTDITGRGDLDTSRQGWKSWLRTGSSLKWSQQNLLSDFVTTLQRCKWRLLIQLLLAW